MGPRRRPRTPPAVRVLKLLEWREYRGLTQQELADRMRTHHVNVSRWEKSNRAIPPDTIAALAVALDTDPGSLFRLPGPSLDSLLNGVDDATRQRALEAVIASLVRKP